MHQQLSNCSPFNFYNKRPDRTTLCSTLSPLTLWSRTEACSWQWRSIDRKREGGIGNELAKNVALMTSALYRPYRSSAGNCPRVALTAALFCNRSFEKHRVSNTRGGRAPDLGRADIRPKTTCRKEWARLGTMLLSCV